MCQVRHSAVATNRAGCDISGTQDEPKLHSFTAPWKSRPRRRQVARKSKPCFSQQCESMDFASGKVLSSKNETMESDSSTSGSTSCHSPAPDSLDADESSETDRARVPLIVATDLTVVRCVACRFLRVSLLFSSSLLFRARSSWSKIRNALDFPHMGVSSVWLYKVPGSSTAATSCYPLLCPPAPLIPPPDQKAAIIFLVRGLRSPSATSSASPHSDYQVGRRCAVRKYKC